MNTAYAQQQHSPPLHYRNDPPPTPHAQYHSQHPIAVAHQSQPHPQSQQPPQMGASYPTEHGLSTLAPGTAPTAADPLPRSCVENGWRYEYVSRQIVILVCSNISQTQCRSATSSSSYVWVRRQGSTTYHASTMRSIDHNGYQDGQGG
jgi:hypothetical protein